MTKIEEVAVCEEQLLQAMRECDLKKMDQLLHDDLLFNGPDGKTITKNIDLAAYQSGNMVVEENNASDQQINFFDDTAVVTVTIHLKGQFMKQPINSLARFIRVWKEFEHQWKVIGGASHITG